MISPSLSSPEEAEEAKEEEKKEKKEIKEANLKRHEERCDCRCLAAVIATAELNKKAGGRTRRQRRGMKGAKWKEDGQQEEAVETGLRIRPSPGFPSPLGPLRTNYKEGSL